MKYLGKIYQAADPNQPQDVNMLDYIHFDQRKYKYLFYAFCRNHFYEWSFEDCQSCVTNNQKHNPFMKSCDTAKEIIQQTKETLQ